MNQSPGETLEIQCPLCGGTRFTQGEIPCYGPMRFAKTPADAGQRVLARKCEQCGNVQLFVRPQG